METNNPYQPPQSDLTERKTEQTTNTLRAPKGVSAGQGWQWFTASFNLFKKNPLPWIIAVLLSLIVFLSISLLPFIGSLVGALLGSIIYGGLMLGCYEADNGGQFQFKHLFEGFQTNTSKLLLIGLIYIILMCITMIPMIALVGKQYIELMSVSAANPEEQARIMATMDMNAYFTGIGLTILLSIPMMMMYWLAPPLVAIHGISPISALKTSFIASFKNLLPIILLIIIVFITYILSIFTLFLGLLVLIPIYIICTYSAYKDILTEEGLTK